MSHHPIFPLACPNDRGVLLLTPCPGTKNTSLEASLVDLKAAGATSVLTLMTAQELSLNKTDHLQSCCRDQGLSWFHLPVEDEGAPSNAFIVAWKQYRSEIHKRLDNNEGVVIHCKGGSGRTGIVAAQILMERGVPKDEAISNIKVLRPNAFSHTVQLEYINQLANSANTSSSDS